MILEFASSFTVQNYSPFKEINVHSFYDTYGVFSYLSECRTSTACSFMTFFFYFLTWNFYFMLFHNLSALFLFILSYNTCHSSKARKTTRQWLNVLQSDNKWTTKKQILLITVRQQHNPTIYVERYLRVPIQHCALYPLPVIAFSLHTHFSVSLPLSALHTTLCGSPTDGSWALGRLASRFPPPQSPSSPFPHPQGTTLRRSITRHGLPLPSSDACTSILKESCSDASTHSVVYTSVEEDTVQRKSILLRLWTGICIKQCHCLATLANWNVT